MAVCPVQLHCVRSLPWIEALPASPQSTSSARCLKAGPRSFPDERALELSQCTENVEDQLPRRRIGVDRILQALQAYTSAPQQDFGTESDPEFLSHRSAVDGVGLTARKRLGSVNDRNPSNHPTTAAFDYSENARR